MTAAVELSWNPAGGSSPVDRPWSREQRAARSAGSAGAAETVGASTGKTGGELAGEFDVGGLPFAEGFQKRRPGAGAEAAEFGHPPATLGDHDPFAAFRPRQHVGQGARCFARRHHRHAAKDRSSRPPALYARSHDECHNHSDLRVRRRDSELIHLTFTQPHARTLARVSDQVGQTTEFVRLSPRLRGVARRLFGSATEPEDPIRKESPGGTSPPGTRAWGGDPAEAIAGLDRFSQHPVAAHHPQSGGPRSADGSDEPGRRCRRELRRSVRPPRRSRAESA